MSIDLPMWEDDESDIKIEYRLQSGHVWVEKNDINLVLKKLQVIFSLGHSDEISDEIIPQCLPDKKGVMLLEDDNSKHFILAKFKSNVAIFAPHTLFFSSINWIKLSRKLNTKLAFVRQADFDLFGYYIFDRGQHICNAHRDLFGIHESKMEPMEFYLDGKLIYKINEEKDKLTQDILDFISEDVIICIDENRKVQFKTPLSQNEYKEPEEVRHVVFKSKPMENKHNGCKREIPNPIDILIDKVGGIFSP